MGSSLQRPWELDFLGILRFELRAITVETPCWGSFRASCRFRLYFDSLVLCSLLPGEYGPAGDCGGRELSSIYQYINISIHQYINPSSSSSSSPWSSSASTSLPFLHGCSQGDHPLSMSFLWKPPFSSGISHSAIYWSVTRIVGWIFKYVYI